MSPWTRRAWLLPAVVARAIAAGGAKDPARAAPEYTASGDADLARRQYPEANNE
jgi:hypothetical protein